LTYHNVVSSVLDSGIRIVWRARNYIY
jgi:Lrp/AsnC family transcriptional regulator for asnA, asnC and gidA